MRKRLRGRDEKACAPSSMCSAKSPIVSFANGRQHKKKSRVMHKGSLRLRRRLLNPSG